METLRLPLFITAGASCCVAFCIEIGSHFYIGSASATSGAATPGIGINALALLDGLVTLTIGLMGLSLVIPQHIHGRLQGLITGIVSIGVLVMSIFFIIAALSKLLLMVGLLFAPIFGTIAYFAIFADFNTTAARATLGLLFTLKIVFAVALIFSHQRFFQNTGLIIIIVSSLLVNFLVSFLQAIVPGFLVSITDAVAAIIVGIVALIWSLIFLIGSLGPLVKSLKT
ncbi:MAG: hypothetical protein JW795_18135 [Chitinivibrionales bacterium]|nr:hypothetical protein [Chitinivibrionales bacterium]